MPAKDRLTNNSDETDIASLLSGDSIFSIPYFQRPYKWKRERVKQLNSDILELVDETSDFHFLGAVIVHGRRSNPSDPDTYDVIDGQQRITTLYLYLCATVAFLAKHKLADEAAGLLLKYLLIARETKTSNLKLHPGKEDRAHLNFIMEEVVSSPGLSSKLGAVRLKKLPAVGTASAGSALVKNYRMLIEFLEEEFSQGGMDRVQAVYSSLLGKMSVVQIDVKDPTSGPKIFDSLNSRQEPMTVGDLIRNEIFSRVADEKPDFIDEVDQETWQPFYKKFDVDGKNIFDSYFFPYGLIENPGLKKSGVYGFLRKSWEKQDDPRRIVENLSSYQDEFLDLVRGTNTKQHAKDVASSFRRMWQLGAPSSTYPFLMKLSHEVAAKRVSVQNCTGVLDVLESFLVRRAVCGIEPTGLHAVFKKLWAACGNELNQARVAEEISSHTTVAWPGNVEFRNAVALRPLYQASVTKFFLSEYDRSMGGDVPQNKPWIEHVLPQNPDSDWVGVFTEKEKKELVNTVANLIPLSGEMNGSIGNRGYALKRKRYAEDAMYKSARMFAERFDDWNPMNLQKRASDLSGWAVKRWSACPSD